MMHDFNVEFSTKKGRSAVIRYPTLEDAIHLTNFINTFSKEDLFTRFSGEQFSVEEEQEYLKSELEAIAKGDAVKLFCYVEGKLAGVCDIHRDTSLLTRKLHCGIFGIIVARDFRGEGVGELLMTEVIKLATHALAGLKLVTLNCFATNRSALSLYTKLGFSEVGRVPKALFYKGEYIDEVLMTKEVASFRNDNQSQFN